MDSFSFDHYRNTEKNVLIELKVPHLSLSLSSSLRLQERNILFRFFEKNRCLAISLFAFVVKFNLHSRIHVFRSYSLRTEEV